MNVVELCPGEPVFLFFFLSHPISISGPSTPERRWLHWNPSGMCDGNSCSESMLSDQLTVAGQLPWEFPRSLGIGKTLKCTWTERALLGTDQLNLDRVPESMKPCMFLFLACGWPAFSSELGQSSVYDQAQGPHLRTRSWTRFQNLKGRFWCVPGNKPQEHHFPNTLSHRGTVQMHSVLLWPSCLEPKREDPHSVISGHSGGASIIHTQVGYQGWDPCR